MPTKEGARKKVEKGKRTLVEVPEDVHLALKVYAVQHGTQVKHVVAEALRKHLGLKEQKVLQCLHCFFRWLPRIQRRPRRCPACKRYNWDVAPERRYVDQPEQEPGR